jgi:hypothetical protein
MHYSLFQQALALQIMLHWEDNKIIILTKKEIDNEQLQDYNNEEKNRQKMALTAFYL